MLFKLIFFSMLHDGTLRNLVDGFQLNCNVLIQELLEVFRSETDKCQPILSFQRCLYIFGSERVRALMAGSIHSLDGTNETLVVTSVSKPLDFQGPLHPPLVLQLSCHTLDKSLCLVVSLPFGFTFDVILLSRKSFPFVINQILFFNVFIKPVLAFPGLVANGVWSCSPAGLK